MSDEPVSAPPGQDPEPVPVAPAAPAIEGREIALGAIVFVATLLLLLGATRLVERGASGSGPASSETPAVAPTSTARPSSSSGAMPSGDPPVGGTGAPGGSSPVGSSSPTADPVLVGAGDIGDCGSSGDESTAALLDGIDGTVFTAGDNAYESGTLDQYRDCYDASWGRHRGRTRPAPGNHDWETAALAGYFAYFGQAAQGPGGVSWYSYDLSAWHVIVLDSTCEKVGGCEPGSAQGRWLAADLAASTATCTLAIFHHPRFSSGDHGDLPAMDHFWRPLYAAGVDVVVNGHDHDYERFAPQDPDARSDPERGVRQFVVGTGGAPLRRFPRTAPNSERRASVAHGVLAFTLRDDSYAWEYVTAANEFRDDGAARCH